MSLATAIAQFLREFEAFDRHYVNATLGFVTGDAELLEQAQRRLGLPARLTLIRRLLMAQSADDGYLSMLDSVIEKSVGLQEKYSELRRNVVGLARDRGNSPAPNASGRHEPLQVWMPTVTEIFDCIEATGKLRGMLKASVNSCRSRSGAALPPVIVLQHSQPSLRT